MPRPSSSTAVVLVAALAMPSRALADVGSGTSVRDEARKDLARAPLSPGLHATFAF